MATVFSTVQPTVGPTIRQPGNALGLSLRAAILKSLFGDGEQGTAQFSDLNRLFLTDTGTDNATLDDDIGRREDYSSNGADGLQPTASLRPVVDARVNLLERTEAITHSSWGKLATGGAVAPVVTAIGGNEFQVDFDFGVTGGSSRSFLRANEIVSQAKVNTASCELRAATPDDIGKTIAFRPSWNLGYVSVTLTEEWQRLSATATAPDGEVHHEFLTNRSGLTSHQHVSLVMRKPQLEYRPAFTRYQKVVTATDYDSVGFPRKVNYDGDDELVTTFPADLGTNVTVARSIPGTGAEILTGQTVGTSFTDNVDNHALIIVNRALTGDETDKLTKLLNKEAGL